MALDRRIEHKINTLRRAMQKFFNDGDMERYGRARAVIRRLRKESTADTPEEALYRTSI